MRKLSHTRCLQTYFLADACMCVCVCHVQHMEAYEFSQACQRVYAFWQYDLCDVFIELMKPVMALDDNDAQQVRGSQGTLRHQGHEGHAHALCAGA